MPSQFHGVVEYPADGEDVAVASPDEEVARLVDSFTGRMIAAERQMPGEDLAGPREVIQVL